MLDHSPLSATEVYDDLDNRIVKTYSRILHTPLKKKKEKHIAPET